MKSLSRVVPAASARQVTSWQLEELETISAASRAAEIEAILEVFRPVEGRRSEGSMKQRAVAWSPVDLDDWVDELVLPESAPEEMFPLTVDHSEPALRVHRVAEAEDEAERILLAAQAQASEILLQAQRNVDAMVNEAQQEISAGRESAYREGVERAQEEARSYLEAAQKIIAETNAWKEDLLEQATPLVIEMVKEIAVKMFGEGIALSDQALQLNLNRVLSNAKSLGDLNIYLHPQDAAVLDSSWRDMHSIITGSRVRVLPADDIRRGGCYVQGQMGAIDGRIETQLKAILGAFSGVANDAEMEGQA